MPSDPPESPARKKARIDAGGASSSSAVQNDGEHDNGAYSKKSALDSLLGWLRKNYSGDVLIPCAVGEKRPAVAYKDDAWSWSKFDEFMKTHQKPADWDWAIVLRELCVIDVDSHETAAELEAKFPALLEAPCETTARGRHYFFRRSATADALGYWDGCAQVLADVDFKTLTKTGTAPAAITSASR